MSTRSRMALIGLALVMTACSGGGGGNGNRICVYPSGCTKVPIGAGVIVHPGNNVVEGDYVVLEGFALYTAYSSSELSYKWEQLSGPSVAISGSTFSTTSFEAPSVSTMTTLTFRFKVKTKSSRKDSADVTVVVEPTSATALCLQAPLYAASYAWTNSGCTTNSADIAGDSRVATLYRQSEAEPNDFLQAANSLIFPSQVATEPPAADVEGSVHRAGGDGKDFFVFTPPSSSDYHVYLCNDPLACMRGTVSADSYLELYDQDFKIVARTGTKLTEQKLFLWLDAGLPYYVAVIGRNATLKSWQYNLTIISD